MMGLGRASRVLVALVGLAAVLIGLPLALLRLGARHLPDSLPRLDEASAAILHPQDGRLLLGLIVVAGWLFWTYLAFGCVVDTATMVRHGARAVSLRRTSPRAITGLLIFWLASTFATNHAPATPAAPVLVAAALELNPAPAEPAHLYVVKERDTLWDIASRELGDPLRWREILDLNRGRTQPDGNRLTDAARLIPGWRLTLPTETVDNGVVVVHAGQTLASIARDQLGDARRYGEIYEASQGLAQPGGGALRNPDVIKPGWLLHIPRTGLSRETPPTEGQRSPTPAREPAPTPSRPLPGPAADPTPLRVPPVAPEPAPEPPADDSTDTAPFDVVGGVAVGGGVAAGVLGLLAHLRRRQRRLRRYRRQIALPDPIDAVAEVAAVRADVRNPDLALLESALRLASATTPLPDITGAVVGSDSVELLGTRETDLAGGFARGQDGEWRLTADQAARIDVGIGYPALTSVGRLDDGRTVFVDLEADGVLHLVGQRGRARDLLRNMTLELATANWAENTELMVVGLEDEFEALPRHRIRCFRSLRQALPLFISAVDGAERSLESAHRPAPELRAAGEIGDELVVTILVVAGVDLENQPSLTSICSRLLERPRTCAAIVTSSSATSLPGPQLTVQEDRTVADVDLPGVPIIAEQMPSDIAVSLLAAIRTAARNEDEPVPAVDGTQTWASDMTIDGSWAPPTSDQPAAQPSKDDPAPSPSRADGDAEAANHSERLTRERRHLRRVEHDDPHLDDDLSEWLKPGQPKRPLISILGEPALRAPGTPPTGRAAWQCEVVVYLALHERGVTRDKLATDLWPEGKTVSSSSVRRTIAEIRPWVGKHPDQPETEFIPTISTSGDDRYRIVGHLLDWDLFRRLRKRAQARAAAGRSTEARADYVSALGLVRGPILRPVRDRGYAWLRDADQHHDILIPGFVIDTAHELVDLAITDDDLELAHWAADIGRLVDPDSTHDRPFLDLMRIAHAEGNTGAMRQYAELLLAERDFEIGEDLPPESFAVFHELFPNGLSRAVDDE
ncbi:LysM peptidoglycan-binding domain-containing protein [Pseudonocardia lutea]|uniref:LysM peptidoglycan-binding domain-containing protein n=1 Tax=Pseudonocardia lutea TaxID=2172015 RepID=A0ABW1IHC6_9PSEU